MREGGGKLWTVLLADGRGDWVAQPSEGPVFVARVVQRPQQERLRRRAATVPETRPDLRVVEQPHGGGTLPRLLLPLLRVLVEDPDAIVFVLPTNRPVTDGRAFTRSLFLAVDRIVRDPERVVLMGARTSAPAPGRVWVMADPSGQGVAGFVRDADARVAAALHGAGALEFTASMVASARTLAAMCFDAEPEWAEALAEAWWDDEILGRTFRALPAVDLLDVLESQVPRLDLMPIRGL